MKTTLPFVVALAAACSLALTVSAQEKSKTPKVGDKAPAVAAKDENGKDWKLADFAGKKTVLLYFYPKDNTPGCTKEACGLRDRMGDLQKDGVEVVGVSFDNAASHKKFIADHSLNFHLLVDTDGKVADAFGARMPDRPMAKRVSFLIGKDGKLAHVTDNKDAMVHLSEMKDAIAKLKK
ncbi:MAG: peroxiredoxin [Verrucomicrobia bacterium]|nr:peroxiredoxin [Verrucomicrobiota bacterium]